MDIREYGYLFYKDGRKEMILNWFDAHPYSKNKKIVVFTRSGTYLYSDNVVDNFDIPEIGDIRKGDIVLFKIPQREYAFYKLQCGTHYIDVNNVNTWYRVDNIDKIEITTELI